MNQSRIAIATACCLMLMAGWLALFRNEGVVPRAPGLSEMNSKRVMRSRSSPQISSAEALKLLRSLPDRSSSYGIKFERVDTLAGLLSDKEILALLEEIQFKSSGIHAGWLRSALWAELGRRDHPEAMSLLLSHKDAEDIPGSVRSQEQFGYLRGRASSLESFGEAMEALLPDYEQIKKARTHDNERKHLNHIERLDRILYASLARLDPELTWNLLQETHHTNSSHPLPGQGGSFAGFFAGLKDATLLKTYMQQLKERIENPDYKQQRLNTMFGGSGLSPGYEISAALAAAELFRHEPEAALRWIGEVQNFDDVPEPHREARMLEDVASRFPDKVMEILTNQNFKASHEFAAEAIAKTDPFRIEEMLSHFSDEDARFRILQSVFFYENDHVIGANYPEPGRQNVTAGTAERHDIFRKALENANLSPDSFIKLSASAARRSAEQQPR